MAENVCCCLSSFLHMDPGPAWATDCWHQSVQGQVCTPPWFTQGFFHFCLCNHGSHIRVTCPLQETHEHTESDLQPNLPEIHFALVFQSQWHQREMTLARVREGVLLQFVVPVEIPVCSRMLWFDAWSTIKRAGWHNSNGPLLSGKKMPPLSLIVVNQILPARSAPRRII